MIEGLNQFERDRSYLAFLSFIIFLNDIARQMFVIASFMALMMIAGKSRLFFAEA